MSVYDYVCLCGEGSGETRPPKSYKQTDETNKEYQAVSNAQLVWCEFNGPFPEGG